MTWLWFAVGAFATYYSARTLAQEDGPFRVFVAWRSRLGKGASCIVCVSAWTAGVVALLMGALGLYDVWLWPIVWLGLAGASVKLAEFWKR